MADEDMSTPDPTTADGEPVRNNAALTALGTLLVNGIVLFNLFVLTDEQKMWIITAVGILGPIVAGYFTRSKVFSPKTVQQMLAKVTQERDQARIEATAVREAAGAVQGALVAQRPRRRQNGAQRPAEAPEPATEYVDQVRQPPPRQTRPQVAGAAPEDLATRRDRFLQQTAQPEGYYNYPEEADYSDAADYRDTPARHAWRGAPQPPLN